MGEAQQECTKKEKIQRAYNRQRKTKQDVHQKRYQVLRNQVKQVIYKAHEDYINDTQPGEPAESPT